MVKYKDVPTYIRVMLDDSDINLYACIRRFNSLVADGYKKESDLEAFVKGYISIPLVGRSLERDILYYGEETGREKYYQSMSGLRHKNDLEYFTSKYGTEEGKKRFESYCRKQSLSNKYEYKLERHGMSPEEFEIYNKSRAITLENLQSKYGTEEGKKRFESYCRKQSYTTSKEYFTSKYGIEAGTKKYENFDKKRSDHFVRSSVSKEETEFFNRLEKETEYKGTRQFPSRDKDNSYYYDYVNFKYGIVVEYNGSNWHANPSVYKETDKPLLAFGDDRTAKDIWNRDIQKLCHASRIKGIKKVFVVWDRNKDEMYDIILKYIKEKEVEIGN